MRWVPRDPNTIFLVTTFTWKMPESSDSMYSYFFMLENMWYHYFTWSALNSQDNVNFVAIGSSWGPKLNWSKFTISCKFGTLQEKRRYHMFSSIKMEKSMEFELSGIFWVKVVTEDIVLASLGTHFMHMRGKLPQKLVKMNGSLCFLQAAIVGLLLFFRLSLLVFYYS